MARRSSSKPSPRNLEAVAGGIAPAEDLAKTERINFNVTEISRK